MKKILSILVACALCAPVFLACDSDDDASVSFKTADGETTCEGTGENCNGTTLQICKDGQYSEEADSDKCDGDDGDDDGGNDDGGNDDGGNDDGGNDDDKCNFGDDADEDCANECMAAKCEESKPFKTCVNTCFKAGAWEEWKKYLKDEGLMTDDAIAEMETITLGEFLELMEELEE